SHDDNVFKIEKNVIRRRENGQESRLTVGQSGYLYENAFLSVELDNGFAVKKLTPRGRAELAEIRSLRGAVEMAVMYSGIRASAPWLLG
ncbi:MAG: hypothetical protein FWG71_07670, partial [Synergistaceae bacterium]|nr:hypothetical protein [Synergistaceae bacterium]